MNALSEKGFRVDEEELLDLLNALKEKVPNWGIAIERRCLGLVLGCIARSSRSCRIAFVAQDGLKLVGQVLKETVERLEANDGREEAGMLALACLACLKALPLGRASLWEHRHAIGHVVTGFDLSQFSDAALNLKGIAGLHPGYQKAIHSQNFHISSYWPTPPHNLSISG